MIKKVNKKITHVFILLSFLLLLFFNVKLGMNNESNVIDLEVKQALADCPFAVDICYSIEWPDGTIWDEVGKSIIVIG